MLHDEDSFDKMFDMGDTPLAEGPAEPKPVFVLNEGQQAALDYLVPFCLGQKPERRALLEGFAGTGKTFTVNRVVEAVRKLDPRISFGMTAPTHKAVRQLYRHSELKDQLDFRTIHSFLALKPSLKKDPKNPRKMIEVFQQDPEQKGQPRRIDQIDVLILDEASMLIDELYELIDEVVRSGRLIVLFMGDPLQIPPVAQGREPNKNPDAIPFVPEQRQSRKIGYVSLTEIVRQGAGNPIIEYSLAIRQQYKNQAITAEFRGDETSGIETLPRSLAGVRPTLEKYFCSPQFEKDPDYMKLVAWRNETVDYFNREIRLMINKADSLPRIVDGDKLVLDKPYFIDSKTMLPNSEELVVLSHEVQGYGFNYKIIDRNATKFARTTQSDDEIYDLGTGEKAHSIAFKIYSCKVVAMDDREYQMKILHEDSLADYDRIQKEMSSSAEKAESFDKSKMWKQFYDMQKKFAQFKYNYAVTAHKAQGSTYDYCLSMEWDIDEARGIVGIIEANRIRYVAATRARNKLFIVK